MALKLSSPSLVALQLDNRFIEHALETRQHPDLLSEHFGRGAGPLRAGLPC